MHNVDGWTLETYDWDPDTGIAELVYERENRATGEVETMRLEAAHPANPNHVGWSSDPRVRALVGY